MLMKQIKEVPRINQASTSPADNQVTKDASRVSINNIRISPLRMEAEAKQNEDLKPSKSVKSAGSKSLKKRKHTSFDGRKRSKKKKTSVKIVRGRLMRSESPNDPTAIMDPKSRSVSWSKSQGRKGAKLPYSKSNQRITTGQKSLKSSTRPTKASTVPSARPRKVA